LAAHPEGPYQTSRAPILSLRRRRRYRTWAWIVGIALALAATVLVGVRLVMVRAEPILRRRVIETLSTRFQSRVELAEIHVWIADGLHVQGKGLKIYGATDPNPWEAGVQPLLDVPEFRFQTAVRDLFREPMRVDTILVDGLTLNIPAASQRGEMRSIRRRGKMSIAVDQFVCTNTTLLINTTRPEKPPLEFDISDLRLQQIGPGQPLRFDAKLVNPKPIGSIHSIGLFGPINESRPRDSAVAGTYSFTHADLATFKGIGGILSSTGRYRGTLGRIEVDGETDTPDFQLTVSGHRVPLHTDFHAIVDGTDGDTYLDPVRARIRESSLTARGKVVRVKAGHGHDIQMDVVLNRAGIQDLLWLGVKTDPPIMTGTVRMTAALNLPAGTDDLSDRLSVQGKFEVSDGYFSNDKLQTRIDALSLRSLGRPKLAPQASEMTVPTELEGVFGLSHRMLVFSSLHFRVPGTSAVMTGQYSLDGSTFDFHGTLKMEAKLSQMTTGWKSILLKPVDPFFSKHGNGTEIPFKITGTRSEPHFGLDFQR
jgi:AsmA-like C-terminal region